MRLADYQSFLPKDEIDPPQAQPVLDQVLPGLFERALAGRRASSRPCSRTATPASGSSPSRTRPSSPTRARAPGTTAGSRSSTEYGLTFTPLPEVEWKVHAFKSPLLKLNEIFPEGILDPEDVRRGRTSSTCRRSRRTAIPITTGAVKNAFGGLLKEVRHYAHKYIHEVLVDLLYMQKELHPGLFVVMDGTVCGNGAGPRTMHPVAGNIILASGDSVAIDAVAAKIMGFEPLDIPYIRMAHERGLGVGDLREIDIVGDDVSALNLGFKTRRSFVIWGDQMIRKGFPPAAREAPPALAARRLGAVRLERLSRPDVVSHHRQAPRPEIHEDGLGPALQKILGHLRTSVLFPSPGN